MVKLFLFFIKYTQTFYKFNQYVHFKTIARDLELKESG